MILTVTFIYALFGALVVYVINLYVEYLLSKDRKKFEHQLSQAKKDLDSPISTDEIEENIKLSIVKAIDIQPESRDVVFDHVDAKTMSDIPSEKKEPKPEEDLVERKSKSRKAPRRTRKLKILDDDEEPQTTVREKSAGTKSTAEDEQDNESRAKGTKRQQLNSKSLSKSKITESTPAETDLKMESHPVTLDKEEDGKDKDPKTEAKKFNYHAYLRRQKTAGGVKKEIPVGSPDCLIGESFIVTGVLECLERGEVEALIQKYGGVVKKGVSKKVTLAVVGEEPGMRKMEKIEKLGITVISEDDLFKMIAASREETKAANDDMDVDDEWNAIASEVASQVESQMESQDLATSKFIPPDIGTQLWTDKYRPTRIEDLIGNSGALRVMRTWLAHWTSIFRGRGREPTIDPSSLKSGSKVLSERAILLAGPPGIGKTTIAELACKEEGYEVIALNASDIRNKKALEKGIGGVLMNRTISSQKRVCLIFDEVDGMSGGDRGGIGHISKMIQTTTHPIICITNDAQSPKMRPLMRVCSKVNFMRPTLEQISKRVLIIMESEGYRVGRETKVYLERHAEALNRDIRQILNYLQMCRLSSDKCYTHDDETSRKDMSFNNFEIIGKFFDSAGRYSLRDRLDLYFMDSQLLPFFVSENYLSYSPREAGNPMEELDAVHNAALSISDSDILQAQIMRQQAWNLLPSSGISSCVAPGYFMRGGCQKRVSFPSHLGRISSTNKRKRLLNELRTHISLNHRASAGGNRSLIQYMANIHTNTTRRMSNASTGNSAEDILAEIDRSAELLVCYNLTKEDYDFVIEEVEFGGRNDSREISASHKRKFTAKLKSLSSSLQTSQEFTSRISKRGIAASLTESSVQNADSEVIEEKSGSIESSDESSDEELKAMSAVKRGGKGARGRGRGKSAARRKKAQTKKTSQKKSSSRGRGRGR